MIGLTDLVAHVKALHIGLMSVWMAGLAALSVLLADHAHTQAPTEFARLRRATHYSFVWVVTPAAVLAVATGTTLIFLREVFVPWMFAKLLCVAGLVALHAWIGHASVALAEGLARPGRWVPMLPLVVWAVGVAAVLTLVLGKPDIGPLSLPVWMLHPLGRPLPFDVPTP